MLSKLKLNQLYFKDTQFANLMTRRIFNVLLIANPYDAFMLEDDGRIDEKIFNEYTSLSLRYPPRFTQVSTCEEALAQLSTVPFDLIICMPGTGDNDSFDVARHIKSLYEHIPMVILTPFSHGITKRIANEDLSPFEYIFCWLGNTDLLVSIIKLIEDKMNLEHDVNEVGVQVILVVEDGIRFYSSILPNLYKFVLKQSQEFSTEALNAHQRTLRMRGRPKIVLARTYEEAIGIYEKYKNNILGVITDVRFPRVERGEKDGLAGIKLCAAIRKEDPFVPLIIQSSESENALYASKYGAAFIDKNSKKMDVDLRRIVSDNFGFGDFIFRNPDTLEEIARVKNLKELQNILFAVPAESFLYHISRNHVSRWLYSRAMFPVAEFLKPITWNSLQDVDAHRKIIFEAIVKYRKMKNQGVVAVFKRDRFDRYSNFARIGDGSLGGKGRGLAFIDNMVKHHPEFEEFDNARVAIPKTVVLCTDVFDEFMETNNLYQVALSDAEDDVILPAWTVQTVTGKPTAYEDATVWTNESMAQYFGVKSVRVGDVGEDAGALLRETHIVAFGSLQFPISAMLIPAQRAAGFMLSKRKHLGISCDGEKIKPPSQRDVWNRRHLWWIQTMKNAERQTEGTQNPKHFINTGICRSHEASLCVPPGAMRKVRSTPFCRKRASAGTAIWIISVPCSMRITTSSARAAALATPCGALPSAATIRARAC